MRADVDYVKDRFRQFNQRIFGGQLPEIEIRMSDAARTLGMFVAKRGVLSGTKRRPSDCHILISRRLDLPENELEDVIIHEMIHYLIWHKGLRDTAPHGQTFRALMRKINQEHGRNITVRHRLSEESRRSDERIRRHYLLHTVWNDGKEGLTQTAQTRLFEIHAAFAGSPDVAEMRWYFTTDPYFNKIPNFITPRYVLMNDEMRRRLAECRECECDGMTFRLKTKN